MSDKNSRCRHCAPAQRADHDILGASRLCPLSHVEKVAPQDRVLRRRRVTPAVSRGPLHGNHEARATAIVSGADHLDSWVDHGAERAAPTAARAAASGRENNCRISNMSSTPIDTQVLGRHWVQNELT